MTWSYNLEAGMNGLSDSVVHSYNLNMALAPLMTLALCWLFSDLVRAHRLSLMYVYLAMKSGTECECKCWFHPGQVFYHFWQTGINKM